MSLLYMDGFDNVAAAGGVNIVSALNTMGWVDVDEAYSSADTRTGHGLSISVANSSTGGGTRRATLGLPNITTIVMGFAVKFFNGSGDLMRAQYDDFAGNVRLQWRLLKNGVNGLSILDGEGNLSIASDNNVIHAASWNYIELRITAGNPGSILVKVNGATVINGSGRTINPGNPPSVPPAPFIFNRVGMFTSFFNMWQSQSQAPIYDDFYIASTAGVAPFNTFLNEVVIEDLHPNSDEGPNDMTPVGIGGGDHYEAVDDLTPDEDATYLYTDGIGDTERFGLTSLPPEVVDILAVRVATRSRREGTGYRSFHNEITLDATTVQGPKKAAGYGYTEQADIFTQKPGGGDWEPEDLEELQVGFTSVDNS